MLEMEAVPNFRTFDRDENGNEVYMTDDFCEFCLERSEVYIKIGGTFAVDNGCDFDDILICKTCLSKGEQLWNEKFLEHARRDRQEQEAFLRGE